MVHSLTAIARRLNFITETEGPNAGAWVNFLQRFCGGQSGESWCCYFISVVEDIAYHGKSPSIRTGSCMVKLKEAKAKGWVVTTPQVDDLYFYVNPAGHAHHIGIVTAVSPALTGIAGNTSPDGKSSNGIGVFEHGISSKSVFVRLPK